VDTHAPSTLRQRARGGETRKSSSDYFGAPLIHADVLPDRPIRCQSPRLKSFSRGGS
jgi:hypothetical protein